MVKVTLKNLHYKDWNCYVSVERHRFCHWQITADVVHCQRQAECHPPSTEELAQMSAAQGTTVHDGLDCCIHTSDIARRQHQSVVHRQSVVSCSYRDTGVRCSVFGPFLWPALRPGTRYQTIFRHVPLTFFVLIWTLFFFRYTSVHSALDALHLCTTYKSTADIDIDNIERVLFCKICLRFIAQPRANCTERLSRDLMYFEIEFWN